MKKILFFVIAIIIFKLCLSNELTDILNETESLNITKITHFIVTGSDVNFRETPCTNGRIIGKLQVGNKVRNLNEQRTACGHSWRKINFNSKNGWAAAQYLRNDGGNKLCFPLKQNSLSEIRDNWGDSRSNGI